MNIKKPNSFARYGNDYVAPLTTIYQIVKPSGERYTGKEFELISNVENVMFGENGCGKNLLNPTLQTTTVNGVTCINNGDGTFTLNGTASDITFFYLIQNTRFTSGTYKAISKQTDAVDVRFDIRHNGVENIDIEDGNTGVLDSNIEYNAIIRVGSSVTLENYVLKPMLTTDLSATYDDFEPYVKSLKQLTNSALNMDLLWTNASPYSSFSPQTISLDLADYEFVLIKSKRGTGSTMTNQPLTSIGLKDAGNYISAPDTDVVAYRIYAVTKNSIIFLKGNYTGANEERNDLCVPLEICGVR